MVASGRKVSFIHTAPFNHKAPFNHTAPYLTRHGVQHAIEQPEIRFGFHEQSHRNRKFATNRASTCVANDQVLTNSTPAD